MRLLRYGLTLLCAAVGLSAATAQELVQNPDFSNNTFGSTQYNLSNSAFNAAVPFCTAFGSAQEIELVYGADFGPVPPVGNTKIGIHTQFFGAQDQLSMTLASPVGAGSQVRLRFWSTSFIKASKLVVGISNSPTSFGTEIYRTGSSFSWVFTDVVVTVPQAGQYLTLMPDPGMLDGYINATGFSVVPANVVKLISATPRPREIRSGERSNITVTLNGNAPAGGAFVFVSYSAAALVGPGVVVVPAGRRSATFAVYGVNGSSTTRRVDLVLNNGISVARTYVLVRPAGR